VIFFFRPIVGFSRWHAYNPLERFLIGVPIDVVADPPSPQDPVADGVLRAFGLEDHAAGSPSSLVSGRP
jgi:hypothetical protein